MKRKTKEFSRFIMEMLLEVYMIKNLLMYLKIKKILEFVSKMSIYLFKVLFTGILIVLIKNCKS